MGRWQFVAIHGRKSAASSQQVNFDQIYSTPSEFFPLPQVFLAILSRTLIRFTQDFDHGDDVRPTAGLDDFNEAFGDRLIVKFQKQRLSQFLDFRLRNRNPSAVISGGFSF